MKKENQREKRKKKMSGMEKEFNKEYQRMK